MVLAFGAGFTRSADTGLGGCMELRAVLQTLHDAQAHGGTLSIEELETLRVIIDDLASYQPGHAQELEDNLAEAEGEIRQVRRAYKLMAEGMMALVKLPDWEETFMRAGDVACDHCGLLSSEHPSVEPTFHLLCTGKVVKL